MTNDNLNKKDKIYPLNEENLDIQVFLCALKNKDYETAKIYLPGMLEINDNKYKKNALFYVYLFSYISSLDNELKSQIKDLNIKSIKINTDSNNVYKAKVQALKGDFKSALKELHSGPHNTMFDQTAELLLDEAYIKKRELDKKIDKLTRNRQYEEVKDLLVKESNKHTLTRKHKNILELASTIVDINCGRVDITIQELQNYRAKLRECIEYGIEKQYDYKKNASYIMLKEIINLSNKKLLKQVGSSVPKDSSEYQYFMEVYNQLINGEDAVISKRLTEDQISSLGRLIKNAPSVSMTVLDSGKVLFKKMVKSSNKDFKEVLMHAKESYKYHDYDKALNLYKSYLNASSHPSFAAYYKIGKCYLKKGNIEEAIKYLNISAELIPSNNLNTGLTKGKIYSLISRLYEMNEDYYDMDNSRHKQK